MINVDSVYQKVLTLANKQQRGYDVRNNHNDTIWYRIDN